MFSTVSVWMMMNTVTGDFRHKRVFDRHVLTYLRSFHRYSFILLNNFLNDYRVKGYVFVHTRQCLVQ